MSNFLVGRGLNDAAYDVFSGTGAQTVFSLTSASSTSAATVSISGVVQRPVTDYSVAGTTLTFVAAPPSGTNNILVQYNKSITIGTPADGTITAAKLATGAVETAKIADDAVTLAKMAGGTDGNLITYDANGDPAYVATGTAGQVLTSNGAGAAPTMQDAPVSGFTFTSDVATTSGISVTVSSSIPSGTTEMLLVLEGVSGTTDSFIYARIGDSGGIETSGYESSANSSNSSSNGVRSSISSFIITGATNYFDVNADYYGAVHFHLADAANNTWVCTGCGADGSISTTTRHYTNAGTKSLSAELTQMTFHISAGAFDNGSVRLGYK